MSAIEQYITLQKQKGGISSSSQSQNFLSVNYHGRDFLRNEKNKNALRPITPFENYIFKNESQKAKP
jgi:hypothetical protein